MRYSRLQAFKHDIPMIGLCFFSAMRNTLCVKRASLLLPQLLYHWDIAAKEIIRMIQMNWQSCV